MKQAFLIILTLVISITAESATEPPRSIRGKITFFSTGINRDQVRIKIQGSKYNESRKCRKKDSYILTKNPNRPNNGFDTTFTTLLSAFMNEKEVSIIVDLNKCTDDRPTISGVELLP